jgi:hypothetical protein
VALEIDGEAERVQTDNSLSEDGEEEKEKQIITNMK